MDTGVVITQEPVFTKTSVEEAHAGVVLEHSTMDVDKINLSTVLDDSRTSTIEEKPEVAEVLNGPGNKETEESKHEKEEVVKTISVVEDSKMVKEKERETETDEQGTVFVQQPKNTDDAKVILTDVTLEKEKEDETTPKPEEVSVETETKNSQEQEKDISKAIEEIPTIRTDEVEEEKDSRTVETSVNGTKAEHNETVSVEEITRNGDNIMKETAPEQDVETTERVLVEAEKDETETVNTVTVVKDPEIVGNEETTVHDLKENEDTVEAIKNSDDAEQVSREVTGDKEKEEDIIHKEAEVQESPTVIETPTIQGEDTESKASKETEEHEHVLVRDIPQDETLVPKAETVDTSTVQESAILKTMETKSEMPQQGEAESLVTKEVREQEDTENFEVPIDLALKVDREELMDEKKEADQVAGAQSIERGLALNESEAEETPVIQHSDVVESGEQMEKPSLESPSKLSEETRKTLEEKIQEKTEEEEEEEVSPHQEGQEEGSYGSEKVPVPESIESCLPVEKDEEVKSDEFIQVSSASPEGEKLVEAKKIEVIKANEEEEQLAADKTQSILDTEPVKSNEETTVHESIVSHEVTGDREKEEDIIIHKAQEVQESPTVIQTPTIQGEDTESKASKETEEHEHVLVRDIPQEETLVPKAETVNTSTVHVSGEPSLDLKEQEETVKTVTSSDEVQQSITLMEPPKLSPEQISKDTKEDEHVLERSMPQGEIFVTEAESLVTKESKETVMDLKEQEKTEKLEEVPSDLALEVDKEEVMEEKKEAVDDVAGDQNMERGLELNESEAELVEKQSIESPSEETSKTLDEKIQEEVSSHQEVQEEGSYELKEKSQEERSLDLTPLQEESCLPLEQNEEEIKEQIHKHEQENEEVKSDEVTQISSGSPEGESVVEAKKKEEIKANEEEQVVRTETVNTVVKDPEIVSNEETAVHDLKENEEAVEAIKNSDDAEQVSREVTGDKEKEEDIIHKEAEVQESPTVIQTPTIQGEDIEPKASKETEEHEHVLVRDIPQDETLVDTKAETVDTSTVQESAVLKTLETKSVETDTEPSLDLKEEEETITPSDEVLVELPKPSPDQRSIDTEENEHVLGSKMPQQGEAESLVTKEEVAPHQEGQEEGCYGSETVPVPESIEQEESCLPVEKDEEVKSDDVIQVSSASPEGEKLVEAKKIEVIKSNEEEEQLAADKTQSILDTEPVKSNEETTVHESIVSHEETGDREKEEDIIIHKAQEVQESLTIVETPTIEDEDIELKASMDNEEHEHVLVRDIPQEETLVPKAETVNTSTVHVSAEPSLDLKEQEETVKTVTSSDEVQQSITLMEPPKLSPEKISKDTKEDEHVLERSMPQGEIFVTEAESLVTKENKEAVMDLKEQEKTEKLEEVPSDLALKVDKEEVMEEKKEAADDVAGDQNMERGLELNESEAELVDQNITDKTEEELVEKQSIESPSEETSKTLDEKIQEEVSPHQEVQEEGSYELKEKSQEERSLDLSPLQEESCLPLEQNKEEIKEQIHKHEQENEEVKSEEVTQVSSESPEGETVVEAKKKEEIKASEEEQVVADKIQSVLETVETVDTEPVKSNEDDIAESLNSAGEEIQTERKDGENVQKDETAETSVNGTEDEHKATVLEEGISKNDESIVPEKTSEEIKNSDEAEEKLHKVTGDREKEEDIMTWKTTEEMHEENTTIEHENLLVRDVPQIVTFVAEAEDVNTSTVHKFESNEAEVGQVKQETETVISSDEVRPSEQVDDVETEEYVEVKPKEPLQGESTEEKLLDVPSADSEKIQPETVLVAKTERQDTVEDIPSDLVLKEEVKDDKTEVDGGTQVMGETRDLEPNEPEAEQTDQTKTVEKLLVESVEKMQTSSLEFPYDVSEEKTTTVDDKMEEVTLQQEKSDEVIKVSSVSPSEEQEGEIIVEDKTEEEQVVEKIKNSLEPLEPQSLMPSYSEEQEHKTISEKTEDEKVKEEEPSVQILSEEDETKSHVTEAETEVRDTQQGETIDEPESVDTSTVQEAAVLNTLEIKINESEAVHSAVVGEEEERQVPSLESPSEETSKTADEKIEEEVTLHQESEETVTVPESSELGIQAKEEEDSTSAVEEKSDQVSSAPLSEEPEAEKIEDLKENEEEQVAEAVEPHSSPPEESNTVAEKVKETEPMGDTGTGSSSKLVEEEKLKQDKEILEVPSSGTIPQETLSDDVTVVQPTITETHEEEATVAQTRDIETLVTDKFSIHQEEEQANEESLRKKVISAEEGETQIREHEEEKMVDSSGKNDNETLIAETKKEDEDETVGLDDASKTSENECSKQEEFENLETPKVEDKSQLEVSETIEEIETTSPSFITELEDQIPKQIKEIHEEEIKEAQAVVDQTSSLVSEQVEEIHEEETKESHKVEDLSGQNIPVEASQTLSSELDNKTAKQVEQETKAHKLQEEEEQEKETKPKESDDQIETSTDVTKVEDEEEDTKETDTQVAEIMKAQELKGTLQPGAAMEDQDPENSSDDFTFSKSIGDENSSTLPVVGILKELQTSLEENERGNDLKSINAEPETLEKSLVLEETPASEIIEANMLQDSISRELEFNVEETPADLSLTEVLPGDKILIPSNQEEGKKQEDLSASTSEKISLQEEDHPGDFEIFNKEHNAEAQETVKEEDQTFDIKEEKKNEELQDEKLSTLYATRETDETSSPEVNNNNNNQEDASELGVGHDSATTPQVEEEQEAHSVLGNDQEVLTSEKKITEPLSVAEKELTEQHVQAQAVSDDTKSSNEMDFNSEQIPKNQREEAEETADSLITGEKVQLQDLSKGFGQEKQESTDLTYVQEDLDDDIKDDGHDSVLAHEKDSDLIEEKKEVDYVKTEPKDTIKQGVSTQEKEMCEKTGLEATKEIYQGECKKTDTAIGVKEEIKEEEKETTEAGLNSMKNADDESKDYGLDSVVAQKKESVSIEEKKEDDYVKTELEDAVKHGVCTEENNNMFGKIGQEATKEIYEEESKQTNTVTAIKEEMKEEKKDTPEDFLNSMKNTDDATEKSKPEIQEIDKLSPASETPQKQGDEVPTQQKREIADDVPKIENLEIAEEVQQKYGEDETEPTVKEPARKSLSDLIQNVKVTDKPEVATTEPRMEEEATAEGEDEDGDEHKDDKTSPDSIVMVEAKDTVSIIKTQKKSHGILSGVGSKVKHSISKVKKALTGKSSHPTKPSSPQ